MSGCRCAMLRMCACVCVAGDVQMQTLFWLGCFDPGLKPPFLARPGCLWFGSRATAALGRCECVTKHRSGHALLAAYRSEHSEATTCVVPLRRGCSYHLHEEFACFLWQVWQACLTMLMDMPLLPETCLYRKSNAAAQER